MVGGAKSHLESKPISARDIQRAQMLGASTGDHTLDRVMWKRTVKQGFRTQGAPQTFSGIYPQTRVCLPYCIMPITNAPDINRGLSLTTFSGENQLRALANKSPGHERNISNQPPSVIILACLAGLSRLLQLTHRIVQSPSCERHGKPKTQSLSKS